MKILFVVPSYKPAYIYGGTIVVIFMLAEQLVLQGNDVSVFTTNANGKFNLDVKTGVEVLIDGVKVTYFNRVTGDHTHISPSLWKNLYTKAKDFDVVHIHSWWNPLIIGAVFICLLKRIKPIFSPHGMLSSYIIETNNPTKKRFLNKFIGTKLLRRTILHVTAQSELDECQELIPNWGGKIIPNLVKLPSEELNRERKNEIFTIGFLSRIDRKKGLDFLIKSLSKVSFDYRFLIGGDGDLNYISELKELIREHGIEQKIKWVGWKNGTEKFKFLSEIDLFALTSHNENFAIVVIEALSVGTPVLVSKQVGLSNYLIKSGQGWACDLDITSITANLEEIHQDSNKLANITNSSPLRIRKDFDPKKLTLEYIDLYDTASLPVI
ncbi:XrtY-associated glycosyltransferase XYAG1 [Pedobacter sp. PWIIR3]